jgi:hypothetical protein
MLLSTHLVRAQGCMDLSFKGNGCYTNTVELGTGFNPITNAIVGQNNNDFNWSVYENINISAISQCGQSNTQFPCPISSGGVTGANAFLTTPNTTSPIAALPSTTTACLIPGAAIPVANGRILSAIPCSLINANLGDFYTFNRKVDVYQPCSITFTGTANADWYVESIQIIEINPVTCIGVNTLATITGNCRTANDQINNGYAALSASLNHIVNINTTINITTATTLEIIIRVHNNYKEYSNIPPFLALGSSPTSKPPGSPMAMQCQLTATATSPTAFLKPEFVSSGCANYAHALSKDFSLTLPNGNCSAMPSTATITHNSQIVSNTYTPTQNCTWKVDGPNGNNNIPIGTSSNYTLTLPSAGIYTITCTTPSGCSQTRTVMLGAPSVSANPVQSCIPVGSQTTVTLNVTSANSPQVTYYLTGATTSTITTNNLALTQTNGIGNYSVMVKDIHSCTATATWKIGNQINASILAASANGQQQAQVYCLSPNTSATLAVSPSTNSFPNNPINYSWLGGNFSTMFNTTNSNFSPANPSANPYMVIVTDNFGCSGTATLKLGFGFSISNLAVNPNCFLSPASFYTISSVFTSWPQFNTLPLLYSFNGSNTTIAANGSFIVNQVPNFTLTVQPLNNTLGLCQMSPNANNILIGNFSPCPPSNAPCNANVSVANNYTNGGSASGLGITTLNNANIAIGGTLTINVNTNWNATNIYLLPSARIVVDPGINFTANNCDFSACGNKKWDGIYASNTVNTIATSQFNFSNSKLSNAENGINLLNGVQYLISNSIFTNNGFQSIFINNTFNETIMASSVIVGNTFNYTPASPLMLPLGSTSQAITGGRPHFGIRSLNTPIIRISAWPDPNSIFLDGTCQQNTFENICTGIFIENNIGEHLVRICDVNMSGLQDYVNINGATQYPDGVRYNNIYAQNYGAGIMLRNSSIASMRARVWTSPTTMSTYTNVNKAIVGNNIRTIDVTNQDIGNAIIGIGLNRTFFGVAISNCNMTNVHFGIEVRDGFNALGATVGIKRNTINTRSSSIQTSASTYTYPRCIRLWSPSTNNAPGAIVISDNTLTLNFAKGLGIDVSKNSNKSSNIFNNRVKMNNSGTTTVSTPGWMTLANISNVFHGGQVGISVNGCNNFPVNQNYVSGNYSGLLPQVSASLHQSSGFVFNNSQLLRIRCNYAHRTTFGFNALGNCDQPSNTVDNSSYVARNNFNYHFRPWYFEDNPNSTNNGMARFGQVGKVATPTTNGVDNENRFINPSLSWATPFIDARQVISGVPVSVFRNVSLSASYNYTIATIAAIVQQQNSVASTGLLADAYKVSNIQPLSSIGGANCIAPVPILSIPPPSGDIDPSEFSTQSTAADIPTDEQISEEPVAALLGLDAVNDWIADRELFIKLERDNAYRAMSQDLLNFYDTKKNTTLGLLGKVEACYLDYADLYATTPDALSLINKLSEIQGYLDRVNTGEAWELNELQMQKLRLKTYLYHFDYLSQGEKEEILSIARGCLYEKGTAVLVARSLIGYWEPGFIGDDKYTCQQNMQRGGNDKLEDFDILGDDVNNINWLTVHPNPADNYLILKKELMVEQAVYEIYDIFGKQILSGSFNDMPSVTINTNLLPPGLYTYKCNASGVNTQIGKFIINH